MPDELQVTACVMSFCTSGFIKCSQFCVHGPGSVTRAGRLGAVTSYPASPPTEPGRPRSGIGRHRPCPAKQNITYHFVQCFNSKISTVLCAWGGSQHQGWSTRCCSSTISDIPSLRARPAEVRVGWGRGGAPAPDVACLTCPAPGPGRVLILPLHGSVLLEIYRKVGLL